uniref:Cytochrome c oxidase subunit 3 n=1 Tax=Xibalbanus tulumensis TaxID=1519145 RepID=Q6SKY7_XIBTU|nr:cytochrome c oxidase subunit III [Xibalbanus tulumensis]AAS00886.1 cytochrome c oxidase subunit 3 [Xibalbanus tulumensis]
MKIMDKHPFHLVNSSPWPITSGIGAMTLLSGLLEWFHLNESNMMKMGMTILLLSTWQWWRDVSREGTMQGLHTLSVSSGLRWGMILFITSEVLFFFSFFWAFFNSSLSPDIQVGSMWPPLGIKPFNPFQVPLLNTMILLASGVSITWSHNSMMEKNMSEAIQSLQVTIILGLMFTFIQVMEYKESPFSISDSVYGTTFFVATGFHGLHVIIGTSFLSVCLMRMILNHFSPTHHFGFEAAAWYWHFVDVVWLFLFSSIYWWGY